MRRRTRLGLATIAALLLAAGAYTVFWFVVAGRIESGVNTWAQSARADKIDVSWHSIGVSGYPAAFEVALDSAVLRDTARTPSPEFHVPVLSGTARPWDFADWRLAMPEGFTAGLSAGNGSPSAELVTKAADGLVSIAAEGGWKLWLTLHDTAVEAGNRVAADLVNAAVTVPPRPDRGHGEPAMALEVDARHITLPSISGQLGNTIDELDFAATVKGAVPGGNLADAVAAWRDAGGTIELDNLHLEWGGLGAIATGMLGLDQELQPIGALSGAVQGYDKILTTLVQTGQMRPADAGLARIALGLLAKEGPDGKPEIKTSLKLQGGQMF